MFLSAGPVETVMVMVPPFSAVPVGDWLMTSPSSTLLLELRWTLTPKPLFWSVFLALSSP